ncbi:MAG TPA: FAD-binding oxidoreductase [Abditibacteriaceae bacterium]|jgi:glycolate oxidase FAD binding subunit
MDILSRLQSEFGDVVSPRIADETDAVDGVQPQAIAAPCDEEAAQALVHWCGREYIAFVPRGGGTKLHIGAPPTRCDLIISTEKLTQIFDHDEGNATVQAGAGISLVNLDAEMRKRNQFVPLEGENSTTLGGTVATNHFGGSKLKYGAPRDLVTGLHAVLSDGRLVKAGSKVVKNVSGYDLNKLFIGSFGNLGLITEVTIRLRPESEETLYWSSGFATWQEAESQAWKIINNSFNPTMLYVHWNRTGAVVNAFFEGGKESVKKQENQLIERDSGFSCVLEEPNYMLSCHLPLQAASKWALLVGENGADEVYCECGLGIVEADFENVPDIAFLRAEAEKLGGFLIVEKAPVEMKTPELVWGQPRGDFALMKKLKQSFDAANVCAPGRFIGGL